MPLLDGAARKPIGRRALGYASLVVMIFAWVIQSEVAQYIETKKGFDRPFLVTYINHGCMAFVLVGLPRDVWSRLARDAKMGYGGVFAAASFLSLLYTIGDWTWNYALTETSVAEATVLFNVQSVLTCLLSALVLRERPTALKVAGILVGLAGVAVATFTGDTRSARNRFLGDALAVGSAVAYTFYEVLYAKLLVTEASPAVVNAATALVGVSSLVTTWPFIFVVAAAGLEPIAPIPVHLWPWLALNAGLALAFNVGLMMTVALLSPVTAAVGAMLTIPLAAGIDFLWKGTTLSAAGAAGAALIILGFAALTYSDAVAARPKAPPPISS